MATKTLEEWEKEKGMMVINGDPTKKMTEEHFASIDMGDKHGVDHVNRIKFLQANGYKVTRDNMMADLSAKK